MASLIEKRIELIVEPLMNERNQLKIDLSAERSKNADLDKKLNRADTTIKVLQAQLHGAQHVSTQTEMFAKSVFDIAQKLAHDDSDKDSETRMFAVPLISTSTVSSLPKAVSPAPNDDKINDNDGSLANDPGNMDVAEEVVVELDGSDSTDIECDAIPANKSSELILGAVINL